MVPRAASPCPRRSQGCLPVPKEVPGLPPRAQGGPRAASPCPRRSQGCLPVPKEAGGHKCPTPADLPDTSSHASERVGVCPAGGGPEGWRMLPHVCVGGCRRVAQRCCWGLGSSLRGCPGCGIRMLNAKPADASRRLQDNKSQNTKLFSGIATGAFRCGTRSTPSGSLPPPPSHMPQWVCAPPPLSHAPVGLCPPPPLTWGLCPPPPHMGSVPPPPSHMGSVPPPAPPLSHGVCAPPPPSHMGSVPPPAPPSHMPAWYPNSSSPSSEKRQDGTWGVCVCRTRGRRRSERMGRLKLRTSSDAWAEVGERGRLSKGRSQSALCPMAQCPPWPQVSGVPWAHASALFCSFTTPATRSVSTESLWSAGCSPSRISRAAKLWLRS